MENKQVEGYSQNNIFLDECVHLSGPQTKDPSKSGYSFLPLLPTCL